MVTPHFLAAQEHYRDLRRVAAQERLATQVHHGGQRFNLPAFWHKLRRRLLSESPLSFQQEHCHEAA